MEGFMGLPAVSPSMTTVVASRARWWLLLALTWSISGCWVSRAPPTSGRVPKRTLDNNKVYLPSFAQVTWGSSVTFMLHCVHHTDYNSNICCELLFCERPKLFSCTFQRVFTVHLLCTGQR